MNISGNISAIQADQTYLNNNANNIANINTDGFTPSQTTFINTNTNVTAVTSSNSHVSLAQDLVGNTIAVNSVAANVAGIQAQNKMFGSLLDIKA